MDIEMISTGKRVVVRYGYHIYVGRVIVSKQKFKDYPIVMINEYGDRQCRRYTKKAIVESILTGEHLIW